MADNRNLLKTSAYLLPNLMTAFNLICGLVAIIITLESIANRGSLSRYALAAWLIIAAMVFDFLDGKVARWTHTESQFGVKIDSLTDFVSFGVAPALLAFASMLQSGPLWLQVLPVVMFLSAGAWRLARFNCESHECSATTHFTGLPIPAAAVLVCALVLVNRDPAYGIAPVFLGRSFTTLSPEIAAVLTAMAMLGLAWLMVSRIPFPAFKRINRRNLFVLIGVALFFAVLSFILPMENIIFLIMLLYLLIGLFQHLLEKVIQQHNKQKPDNIPSKGQR